MGSGKGVHIEALPVSREPAMEKISIIGGGTLCYHKESSLRRLDWGCCDYCAWQQEENQCDNKITGAPGYRFHREKVWGITGKTELL